ncbi:MAG: glycosyltransferase family 4 protein [Burkholderiaceae bacterium]
MDSAIALSANASHALASQSVVILITHLGAGGAERTATRLADHFARGGNQVTLLTLDPQVADFYPVSAGVGRHCLAMGGASEGVGRAALANLRRVWVLRRHLRRLRADVVVALTTECAVLAIIAGFGRSVRVIAAERNYPPGLRINRLWHRLRRCVYRYADAVVVQSEPARRWVQKYTGAQHTRVIPNAVALPLQADARSVCARELLADERRLLLAVGRLTPQKGFMHLIDAFARLAPAHPDWTLVILGEGGQRQTLQARIDSLSMHDRILLPGVVGNPQHWYGRADLFVLSSHFEGFPNVLLEAMACGCAAVSYDCPTGPREIIEAGVNGLLVQPVGDVDALASAIGALMADDAGRQAMAACAASSVLARYAPDRVFALWDQLVQPRSAPPVRA